MCVSSWTSGTISLVAIISHNSNSNILQLILLLSMYFYTDWQNYTGDRSFDTLCISNLLEEEKYSISETTMGHCLKYWKLSVFKLIVMGGVLMSFVTF